MDDFVTYSYGTNGDFAHDIAVLKQETIDGCYIDYGVAPVSQEDNGNNETHPISFLDVQTVPEGERWYEEHHPDYPDYLVEILAEYNWGDWRRDHVGGRQAKPTVQALRVACRTTLSFD